jgi:hypothetical protein
MSDYSYRLFAEDRARTLRQEAEVARLVRTLSDPTRRRRWGIATGRLVLPGLAIPKAVRRLAALLGTA